MAYIRKEDEREDKKNINTRKRKEEPQSTANNLNCQETIAFFDVFAPVEYILKER